MNFNSDGSTNEKMSFSLVEGKYKVKMKLNITSDKLNDLSLSLFTINGLTTQASGVPGTKVTKDVSFVPTSLATTSNGVYEVESYIEVGSSVGTADAVVFGLTSSSDLTNTIVNTSFQGYLEITKL